MDWLHQLFGNQADALLNNSYQQHKVAAVRSREEGFSIGDDFNLHDAVHVLGAKLHMKTAEHRSILEGIGALNELNQRSW